MNAVPRSEVPARGRRTLALTALAACALLPDCRDGQGGSHHGPAAETNGARYLGTNDCAGCHQDIAATFARTGMGRSWYPMTAEEKVEDFERANEIETAGGLRYRMTARDGRFFMRQFVLDSAGHEAAADEREMVYVAGSNNHSRSYVTVLDGHLFQMPVCWYPQTRRWDLCPGYEMKNDCFAREITDSCVFCHNGWMELQPGERSVYREPVPHGIGCERCHGPGSAHVARWRGGEYQPTGEGDPTIVNPARLPKEERIEVCFQCHLGDSKATERVERYGKTARDYRPGTRLTEALVPFHFAHGNPAEFGLSAQADRLIRSRCFRASGEKLECLTCHDPHTTVYGGDRDAAFFRARCLGCHAAEGCSAPAAERAATKATPDDCVSCHMRKGEPDDHRFTAFTDHWIRARIDEGGEHAPDPGELEPVRPDAAAKLPAPELAYARGRAYLLKSSDFPEAVRRRMLGVAEAAFREARDAGFARADASFYLGKTLLSLRRPREATAAFRDAVAARPDHREAAVALGTALLQTGKPDEAASVLATALRAWPNDAGLLSELARTEAAAGRVEAALELLGRAIAEESWKPSLRLNQAILESAIARGERASAACDEALRLDPAAPATWSSCAAVFYAAGEKERAKEAERRAALLAPKGPSNAERRPGMGMQAR